MKKNYILMLILSMFLANATGQDLLFLKDAGAAPIKVTITQINNQTIWYRMYGVKNANVLNFSKNDLSGYKYKGKKIMFAQQTNEDVSQNSLAAVLPKNATEKPLSSTTPKNPYDLMTLKDGTELKIFVQEISETQIRYKKFENPTSPIYSIEKVKVFSIKYTNDIKEVFGDLPKGAVAITDLSNKSARQEISDFSPLTATGTKVYQNGIRLSNIQAENIISHSPNAFKVYKLGKKRVSGGHILEWTSLAMSITGIIMEINEYGQINSDPNFTTTYTGAYLGLGGLAFAICGTLIKHGGLKKYLKVQLFLIRSNERFR